MAYEFTTRLMRTPEVLKLLGVHRSTLWKYVKRGAFPAPVHIGGPDSRMIAWNSDTVQEWLSGLSDIDTDI